MKLHASLQRIDKPLITLHNYQKHDIHGPTARLTQNFLQANGINVMDWPAMSADISPIKHVWDELGRRVRNRVLPPTNVAHLSQMRIQKWYNIPQLRIQNVIQSMRRRCQA